MQIAIFGCIGAGVAQAMQQTGYYAGMQLAAENARVTTVLYLVCTASRLCVWMMMHQIWDTSVIGTPAFRG